MATEELLNKYSNAIVSSGIQCEDYVAGDKGYKDTMEFQINETECRKTQQSEKNELRWKHGKSIVNQKIGNERGSDTENKTEDFNTNHFDDSIIVDLIRNTKSTDAFCIIAVDPNISVGKKEDVQKILLQKQQAAILNKYLKQAMEPTESTPINFFIKSSNKTKTKSELKDKSITKRKNPQRQYKKTRRYPCEICGLYLTISKLKYHKNVHKDIKPYECKQCQKRFSSPFLLKKHAVLHDKSKIKWDFCDICGQNVRQRNYKLHKSFHFPPTLPCAICGKLFNNNPALKKHQYVHTQERRYKCTLCDNAYSNSSTLKIHMRTHTNEKPFKCSVCDKAFTYNYVKKAHIKKYHPEYNL